jgi:hypothetical protein
MEDSQVQSVVGAHMVAAILVTAALHWVLAYIHYWDYFISLDKNIF